MFSSGTIFYFSVRRRKGGGREGSFFNLFQPVPKKRGVRERSLSPRSIMERILSLPGVGKGGKEKALSLFTS